MPPIRILITNLCLSAQSGTEKYARDVAVELMAEGHEVALYSPILGDYAEKMQSEGICVVSDLADVPFQPDIIHGHHHVETVSAILRFPEVPAIYVCHDRSSWHDKAPLMARIKRYVAVDEACRKRLVADGVGEDRIEMIHNSVDVRKFPVRRSLPEKPARALLLSHYASEETYLPVVRETCEHFGIRLDVGGNAAGNRINPEEVLREYDIVFGKARCALEAMATGCAVVLTDPAQAGPMVTTENWNRLRPLNFGFEACPDPLSVEALVAEVEKYDPVDAARVSQCTREEASLPAMVNDLSRVYHDVIRMAEADPVPSSEEEMLEVSKYLTNQFRYSWLSRASRLEEEVAQWKASSEAAHEGWAKLGSELDEEVNKWKESAEAAHKGWAELGREYEQMERELNKARKILEDLGNGSGVAK
ncbi:MAG: hypothetical protein CMO55_27610 [Verrucomicrobiales bacterium]|nr:hypothetical protein [Verrucomicrobiales bacterium]